MSNITQATKSERITQVVISSYDGTLDFHEDTYNRGGISITVTAKDPRAALLDELLRFAQPQENECPVREITLQGVIDEMQERRDKLNETWGNNKGEPRKLVLGFTIDPDETKVFNAVLNGIEPSYDARQVVRQALVGSTDW
jgi:hypothetical protein